MFGIGWPELLLIGIVLLVIVGPERLPETLRDLRDGFHKLREMGREAREGFNALIDDDDMQMVRKQIEDTMSSVDFREDLVTRDGDTSHTPTTKASDQSPEDDKGSSA